MKRINKISSEEIAKMFRVVAKKDCDNCPIFKNGYDCDSDNCSMSIYIYLNSEIPTQKRFKRYDTMIKANLDFRKICDNNSCNNCIYGSDDLTESATYCFARWLDEEVEDDVEIH